MLADANHYCRIIIDDRVLAINVREELPLSLPGEKDG